MHSKIIFFDLYQTLLNVDTSREKEGKEAGFREVIVPFLQEKGVSEPDASLAQQYYVDELHKFYEKHDRKFYQHNFPAILSSVFKNNYSLNLFDTEIGGLVYEFRKTSRGFLHLYEGAREVLADLTDDYSLSIASHTQGSYTERELEELGILHFFKHRIYSSDIGFKKTSDQFYQACLKAACIDSENCVMVGDNLYEDMYMAHKNGLHTVWIINPLTKNKKADVDPEASLPIEEIKNLPSAIDDIFS